MLAKYISKTKQINHSSEKVFELLSDFKKLSNIFQKTHQNKDLSNEIFKHIKDIQFTNDTCKFTVENLGIIELNIVHREPFKTIRFSGSNAAASSFNFWIQLVEKNIDNTFFRLTLHTKMNYFTQKLLKSQIEKGVNQVADILCKLPY